MRDFSMWQGRKQERLDSFDAARPNMLQAALGLAPDIKTGDALPLLAHWLYFWEPLTPDQTGPDGHPRRGGFLPPVELPRRMWASGKIIFRAPLRIGDEARRISTLRSIERKTGRSGELVFVTLFHEVFGPAGLAIEEEQNLVYRDAGTPAIAPAAPEESVESVPRAGLVPDPMLLFRFSALTMNSHRIHFDQDYATHAEGYPGLVVQGPLQAILLLGEATRLAADPIATFQFRGVSAAIAGRRLDLHAEGRDRRFDLWAAQGGRRTMIAAASLA